MAALYSINFDKTGSNYSFTMYYTPGTLASGGTQITSAVRGNPGDFTAGPDFAQVVARALSVLSNDRSVRNV